jgi:prepilin-type N-terminal cleavage/methylation domain-containing protein
MINSHVQKPFFCPYPNRAGFTLLEILVAMSLIGIVLVVVMQLFSANLRSLSVSESHVNAAVHAEAIMRNILEDEEFPNTTLSGTTEDGYRYDATIAKGYEERIQALNIDLYQVRVTIYWSDGARQRSISLETLKMTEKKI